MKNNDVLGRALRNVLNCESKITKKQRLEMIEHFDGVLNFLLSSLLQPAGLLQLIEEERKKIQKQIQEKEIL